MNQTRAGNVAGRFPPLWCSALTCAVLAAAGSSHQAAAKTGEVVVEGVAEGGRAFAWEVTNRSGVPVSYFEVPYHSVNRFDDPEGWGSEGGRSKSGKGVYKARSTAAKYDVKNGQTLTFRCAVRERGPVIGNVTVRIGFRDGRFIEVPNVAAPVAHPRTIKWGTPLVMGGCVAVAAIWGAMRRRKAARTASANP